MRVKIGETIYDSEQIPIMLILSKAEKDHIKNMYIYDYKYCSYPNDSVISDIVTFIKVEEPEEIIGFVQY